MIDKAILQINSNAKFRISGNKKNFNDVDLCNIEWLENTTPISKEDIKSQLTIIEQEKQDLITKKASGKQKLKDLGLDDDEIKALIGA